MGIEGNKEFRKNYITVKGLTEENFTEFNQETNTGKLFVKSFDKSEVAASKLLLKMGLSSLFTSQRKIFNELDFSDLKSFIAGKNTRDWPFITSDYELYNFKSIPRFNDKFHLAKIKCQLSCVKINDDTFLFKFKYSAIPMVINLLNRNTNWIEDYLAEDNTVQIYPEHYRKKLPPT